VKQSGARLVRLALERLGVRRVLGIPGVHTTELYDELASSAVEAVLVTHEGGAAFMADGFSRASEELGVLAVVPGAGLTHAMSGIGEAFLAGIPMLVLAGGVRRDSGRRYQLHQVDQQRLLAPLTKATFLATEHRQIMPMIFAAARLAQSGEPGPVLVELPAEVLLFQGEVDKLPYPEGAVDPPLPEEGPLQAAAALLATARKPVLFAGWGARGARAELVTLAERLVSPVATTLQGLSVFPADHPLHVGMGFGDAAVPAARHAFVGCDVFFAIGTRFAEIGTGSYSFDVPSSLIHLDIQPEVFHANYPAEVCLAGDARTILTRLLPLLEQKAPRPALLAQIRRDKDRYRKAWQGKKPGRAIHPLLFFDALRAHLPHPSHLVADDGNHTFLCAELYPVLETAGFLSPTDFNAMGYAVPAAIGVKMAHPQRRVAVVVGDGAFRMTCMEIATAVSLRLGLVFLVFNDGELAQIAQGQNIPYNRKTCVVLPPIDCAGVAQAVGASFIGLSSNQEIGSCLDRAFALADEGRCVIVDVAIDYSRPSCFTRGIVRANLRRFPLREKFRFVQRALLRRLSPFWRK
jgi:acetolactate synthase-1/2/3 large subunit